MLFKGGTSLSKSGLINRFSEDIDVTVNPCDIDHCLSIAELNALGTKARGRELDAIRKDCGEYIRGPLRQKLTDVMGDVLARNGVPKEAWRVEVAGEDIDRDQQSLLFWYPSVLPASDNDKYIRRAVLIESGAKSALDPHVITSVTPYAAGELPELDLTVPGINTADPRRTMWDKIILAHGQHHWFATRGEMKGGGNRLTRHYYDMHQLLNSSVGPEAIDDLELGADCVAHGAMFFGRKDYNLHLATPGTFSLVPAKGMIEDLKEDYAKMAGMIFGEVPTFEAVMESVAELEERLNVGYTSRFKPA